MLMLLVPEDLHKTSFQEALLLRIKLVTQFTDCLKMMCEPCIGVLVNCMLGQEYCV